MTLHIDLNNYRTLVTGVSSGIGAGIADALALAGSDVAGYGIESADSESAKSFFATVVSVERRAFYQSVDFADGVAARTIVDWAAHQLDSLDMVVSNAGRNFHIGASPLSESDWQASIDLNLAAHWCVVQAAKPHLDQAHAPVVIIMGSKHAFYTMPNCFPYNVAKAGLLVMVQSLAIE